MEAAITKMPQGAKMDDYFTNACLMGNVKKVVELRNQAANVRMFLVCDMIVNALYDMDIGLIETIVRRVDGAVPEKDKRDSFANLFGDALDDVMDMPVDQRLTVLEDDNVLIALAKVTVAVACQPTGKNPNARKDRQKAADIILQRTGGRVVEPTRIEAQTQFEQPEWMQQLPGV